MLPKCRMPKDECNKINPFFLTLYFSYRIVSPFISFHFLSFPFISFHYISFDGMLNKFGGVRFLTSMCN